MSELSKRIAEDVERESHTACPYYDKIIAEHIAPLETAIAESQAERERLAAVSLVAADKYQTLQADNAELRKQVEGLRKACELAMPVIADAIMHGMPVTREVADARNKLAAALSQPATEVK